MTATITTKSPKCTRRSARDHNRRRLHERQQRMLDRIENRPGPEREEPMITASNIHYELADRVQGLSAGGIGAMLLLARRIGLIRDIDHNLHLLKRHCPYHESDHVLNIAFNIIAGGKRMQHIELRRTDTVYLDALGASGFPIRPRKETSVAGFPKMMSLRLWTRSIRRDFESGLNSPPVSSVKR